MPCGIVRSANKVIQGHVEVVGQGDEDKCRGNGFTIFISLICLLRNAYPIGHLLLSEVLFNADFLELS